MATGVKAFGGGTGGVIIEAVLTRSPAPVRTINPAIPPGLEEIINKALDQDRDQRHQHAAELRDDLQRLERGADSGGRTAPSDPQFNTTWQRQEPSSTGEQEAQDLTARTGSYRSPRVPKTIDSLAVLPFDNISRDPEHDTSVTASRAVSSIFWPPSPNCA